MAIGIAFLGESAQLGVARAIAAGIVAIGTAAALAILARSAPADRRVRPEWNRGEPMALARSGRTALG